MTLAFAYEHLSAAAYSCNFQHRSRDLCLESISVLPEPSPGFPLIE